MSVVGEDRPLVFPLVSTMSPFGEEGEISGTASLGLAGGGGLGRRSCSTLTTGELPDMGSGMQSTGGSDRGSGRLSETGSGRDGRDSVDTSGKESALTIASDGTGVS